MENSKPKKTILDPEIYSQTRHRDQLYKQAASFLLLLDKQAQKNILQNLDLSEAVEILKVILTITQLDSRLIKHLQEEFDVYIENLPQTLDGGEPVVRALIEEHFESTARDKIWSMVYPPVV